MAIESLSYEQIGERLGVSVNAARGLVKRLRLPRALDNDRKVTVQIDFEEIKHRRQPTPPRSASNYQLGFLKERLTLAESELAAERERSASYRADFERERERGDRLVATQEVLAAELAARRLAVTARSSSWWPWRRKPAPAEADAGRALKARLVL